ASARRTGVPSVSSQLPKDGWSVSAGVDFTANFVSIGSGLRSGARKCLAERFGDSRIRVDGWIIGAHQSFYGSRSVGWLRLQFARNYRPIAKRENRYAQTDLVLDRSNRARLRDRCRGTRFLEDPSQRIQRSRSAFSTRRVGGPN